MDFVRGDKDHLEGTVLLYSHITENSPHSEEDCEECIENAETRIIAAYVSTDLKIMSEFTTLPIEELVKGFEKERKSLQESYGIDKKSLVERVGVRVGRMKEMELKTLKGDVVNVGDFDCAIVCNLAIDATELLYFLRYQQQKKSRMEQMIDEIERQKNFSYRDFKGDLEPYLLNNFLIPLTTSIARQDEKAYEDVSRRFKQFSRDSPFYRDAEAICNLSKRLNEKSQTVITLIQAYLGKIVAIHNEEYEKAEQYKRDIARLNQ